MRGRRASRRDGGESRRLRRLCAGPGFGMISECRFIINTGDVIATSVLLISGELAEVLATMRVICRPQFHDLSGCHLFDSTAKCGLFVSYRWYW